jgi:hypothetical protein
MMRRTIHPESRVLDSEAGLVEYVASDETLDADGEIMRANGARFDRFQRNSPFVNNHRYDSIEHCLGRVVDFKVDGDRVVETAQWAIDVPENRLAQLGFKMTEAGYLKAVSIGFLPEAAVTSSQGRLFREQLDELHLVGKSVPSRIITRWQQHELSACIIPVNPNALAKSFCLAYKAGVVTDDDLELITKGFSQRETANWTYGAAAVPLAQQRSRAQFLDRFERLVRGL